MTGLRRGAVPMYVLGAVILVLVLLWLGFMAVDGLGLATQRGDATVVGKSHRAAGTTYTTTIINGRSHVVPQSTPEAYLLDLDWSGKRVQGAAERELYESVREGDRVRIDYQRRRLTGGVQVVGVSR